MKPAGRLPHCYHRFGVWILNLDTGQHKSGLIQSELESQDRKRAWFDWVCNLSFAGKVIWFEPIWYSIKQKIDHKLLWGSIKNTCNGFIRLAEPTKITRKQQVERFEMSVFSQIPWKRYCNIFLKIFPLYLFQDSVCSEERTAPEVPKCPAKNWTNICPIPIFFKNCTALKI